MASRCAMNFPNIKETISVLKGSEASYRSDEMRNFIIKSEFVERLQVEVTHLYTEQPPRKIYAVITFLVATALASCARVSETIPPLLLMASSVLMAVATVYLLVKSVTAPCPLQQSHAREAEVTYLRSLVKDKSFPEIIENADLKEVLLPAEIQGIYISYYESICREFLKPAPDADSQRQRLNAFIKQNPFKQQVLKLVYTEVPQGISQLASLCEAYSKIEEEIEGRVDALLQIQKEKVQGLKNSAFIKQHESCRRRFMELIESHDEQIFRDYYACAQALVRAVLENPQRSVAQAADLPKDFPTFDKMLLELQGSDFTTLDNYLNPLKKK